jgi:hypothetical protein
MRDAEPSATSGRLARGEFTDYPELLLGVIVPSDNVPDFPPPPAAGAE